MTSNSQQSWTEYNLSDPGVTILEQLRYARSDAVYRVGNDMPDLLTGPDGDPYASLPSAAHILTGAPVTADDLRRIALDVKDVQNVWIHNHFATSPEPLVYFLDQIQALTLNKPDSSPDPLLLKGLFDICVQPKTNTFDPQTVANAIHAVRPLGADFRPVTKLSKQNVTVEAMIDIDDANDPVTLAATIWAALQAFLAGEVQFESLQDALAAGIQVEEIFEGPALMRGFVSDDELKNRSRRSELHTSDLMALISLIPGVNAVQALTLKKDGSDKEWPWVMPILPSRYPALDPNSKISLLHNWTVVYKRAVSLPDVAQPPELPEAQRDFVMEPGEDMEIADYQTVQDSFPKVYGIAAGQLPSTVSDQRRAEVQQLRAFLLPHEQLLAQAQAQTAGFRELMSFDPEAQTYFVEPLPDDITTDFDLAGGEIEISSEESLHEAMEDSDAADRRKNRFLNMLAARFGETVG
ncbi:MAG: hypothetical protein AAF585_11205, partial [Verrucomicrobiota bacterium]